MTPKTTPTTPTTTAPQTGAPRRLKPLKITILDLVAKGPAKRIFSRLMNANTASIMPQVMATWCEELGHSVRYLCYTGFEDLDEEIEAAVEKAIEVIRALGAEIIDDVRLEVPTDRTLASAEAYAYHREFVARTPELYQPATLARIKAGEKVTPEEVQRAMRELEANRDQARKIFAQVDLLLTPTVPIPPPSIADLKKNPDKLRPAELLMLRNTRRAALFGSTTVRGSGGFAVLDKGGLRLAGC